ncbi:deoxyadenosine/deoxycytidine kinase [Robbsia andropogonis]|nr:deoxynucleoside kinase [Robbsia andropogonis]
MNRSRFAPAPLSSYSASGADRAAGEPIGAHSSLEPDALPPDTIIGVNSIADLPITAPSRPVTAPEWPVDAEGRPRYGYVVIEGPVGVGKSALAKVLAEKWAMTPVFEQPHANPFLERFYRDPARHALAVQQHFLLERRRLAAGLKHAAVGVGPGGGQGMTSSAAALGTSGSIMGTASGTLAGLGPVISDFLPEKDALYAELNLDPEEFALYQRLAAQLPNPSPVPDLVIYLQASPEALFARIQKRGSGVELQMSDAYLRALCDAYNQFFYHYEAAPLLTVNAENMAPAEDEADLALLLDHIHRMRGPREFFVKGSL